MFFAEECSGKYAWNTAKKQNKKEQNHGYSFLAVKPFENQFVGILGVSRKARVFPNSQIVQIL